MVSQKFDAAFLKKSNKIKVLAVIQRKGSVSRADISREANISQPTVTKIVNELINDDRLIVDIGATVSEGGRPPNLVRLASESRFIIGIHVGSSHIRGVLSDLDANVIADKIELPTYEHTQFEGLIDALIGLVDTLVLKSAVDRKAIVGVGIAYGGMFNKQTKKVEFIKALHWTSPDASHLLSQRLGLPVRIDNVTRVAAMGELRFGIGRQFSNFICVNIGYGVGAGIIIDGKPFYGSNAMAGEFGHIVIANGDDRECNCGNRGCLEAICSGSGMTRTAVKAIQAGAPSVLKTLCEGDLDRLDVGMIIKAVREDDPLACKILNEAMGVLSLGIINLVNLFDPGAIVLIGRIALLEDVVTRPIQQVIEERVGDARRVKPVIQVASFGEDAPMMGAIALVLETVLSFGIEKH